MKIEYQPMPLSAKAALPAAPDAVEAPDWAKSHDLFVRCEAALAAIRAGGKP
jgi:hypothetical protein